MIETKYEVVVSKTARQMINQHIRFLRKIDNNAAISKRKQFTDAIRSLSNMPERFPVYDDEFTGGKYRKMYVEKWYIVLYKIEGDVVYVDYVIDCRRYTAIR